MNPSNNGMELPPPVMESTPNESGEQANQGAIEQGSTAAPEKASKPKFSAPALPTIPLPTPPVMPGQPTGQATPGSSQSMATTPAITDSDLIEKEWVHKAKQIVERTKDDPYKQSEELSVVKVDYLKKRYNKSVKLK